MELTVISLSFRKIRPQRGCSLFMVRGVEMDVKRRLGILLAGTVLGTSFLVSAPAFADDAQLQQQIDAMQRQLQVMQDQLAETKKQAKAAAQQAQQTQAAQQQQAQAQPVKIPANLYA